MMHIHIKIPVCIYGTHYPSPNHSCPYPYMALLCTVDDWSMAQRCDHFCAVPSLSPDNVKQHEYLLGHRKISMINDIVLSILVIPSSQIIHGSPFHQYLSII